jgi:hypothetical protein
LIPDQIDPIVERNAMKNDEGSRKFLPDDQDPVDHDHLFVEIPADQPSPYQEKIPSGYDPMGEIYLRGRASRTIADGRIAWWILISGWVMLVLFLLMAVMAVPVPELLIILLGAMIPFSILGRGTMAKMVAEKKKNRWRK